MVSWLDQPLYVILEGCSPLFNAIFYTVCSNFRTALTAFFMVGLKLLEGVDWNREGLWLTMNPEVLSGTTLEVYRFLLKSSKPVGTRELQRALNLSSSSVATYHLTKLEDAGLLKREMGGFTVSKFLLENSVKVSRFLVLRYFFYSVFAIAALLLELTVMKPNVIYREYAFSLAVTGILVLFLCYETAKTWLRGNL
jgi:DNA-binding transcriptional ArsR family regulator